METLPLCVGMNIGKPELSWQLKLVRDVKSNEKGFSRDSGSKKKTKENVGSLLNVVCDPATKGMENIFSTIKERFICAWNY